MKITRNQLRRLIEASVRKRGDYVIPVEDPIEDPIAGLDYSDEQKPKIKTLAMSDDEENQVYADYIADMGGHEDTDADRFGADTFSKKVQATELGIDMLNDLDIDSAISKACDYWIYENKDYLSYYDHIDQDSFEKYADYMIEEYDGDQAIANKIKVHTTAVLDERIKKLIDISNSAMAVPSVDEKVAYYENSKKLFSTDHNHPAVEDHMIFKFKSVLYPFYLDWKSYYEEEQGYDMSNPEHAKRFKERIATFKEGKVRLTREQLRKLIIESFIVDDKGNVVLTDDAYDKALDTATASIDKSRARSGKSPIGRDFTRSSDPEDVIQGLEFADALDVEYSDFERTALDVPEDDRNPEEESVHRASLKAKYGQGRALGEVYSLVVMDNKGKEVSIPIIDDHSMEVKKRGEGIPENTMFDMLDNYRDIKKQKIIMKNLGSDYHELDLDDEAKKSYSAKFVKALRTQEAAIDKLEYRYYKDLLSNYVHEILSYYPYNYNYQDAQNFEILRIEPRHKELEAAINYAKGME